MKQQNSIHGTNVDTGSSRTLIRIALMSTISLFVAVCVFVFGRFSSIGTDGVFYALMAKSIAMGHGLTVYGVPHTIFSPLLPAFIALMYAIGVSLEVAAQIPVMVFSVGIIIGVYFIGKKIHSPLVGFLSAFFLATSGVYVWCTSISPTPQLLSGFFSLIAMLCLIGVENQKTKRIFLYMGCAGACIGLAYLARPEYFFLFFPVLGYLAYVLLHTVKRGTTLLSLVAFIVAFFVVIAPYLYYLHNTLGYWTISGRGAELALIVTSEDMETVDESSGTGLATVVAPPTLAHGSLAVVLSRLPVVTKRLADGLVNTEHTLLQMFGVMGVIAFGFGLRFLVLGRRWYTLTLFVIFLLPIVLVAFAQGGSPNYLVQYFFLLTPIIAIGLYVFVDELVSAFLWRAKVRYLVLGLFSVIFAGYLLIPLLQNILFLPADYRDLEYKQLGLWMNQHISGIENETVVSRKPEPTFYANSLWSIIPNAKNIQELSIMMIARNQHYFIADDRNLPESRPELVELLDENNTPKEFTLLHVEKYQGKRALLYKIVNTKEE